MAQYGDCFLIQIGPSRIASGLDGNSKKEDRSHGTSEWRPADVMTGWVWRRANVSIVQRHLLETVCPPIVVWFMWKSSLGNWIEKAEHIATHLAPESVVFLLLLFWLFIKAVLLKDPQGLFLGRNHLTQVASFISEMIPGLLHKS